MARRRGGWGFLALATAAGVAAAVEHGAWAWACTAPVVRGDGARHAIFVLSRAHGWAQGGPGPLAWLMEPLYYPTFTAVTAVPFLKFGGGGAQALRASLALYTGVLVAGTAVAAWRVSGRRLGLAAGLAVLTVPLLWMMRADVMLDVPLAGMTAAFLAALPLRGASGLRLGRALACGLLLAVGLLTKQVMPYLAGPALIWVGLPALWRALRGASGVRGAAGALAGVAACAAGAVGVYLRGHGTLSVSIMGALAVVLGGWAWRRREAHLGELVGVGSVALALAGPWYARSVGPILEGLRVTRAAHPDVPVGLDGLWRTVSMTPYATHHLLPVPWALALLVGCIALPWWTRRRPLIGPAAAAFVGGVVLISSFPDLHARHYAPLVGPALVMGAASWDALASRAPGRRWGGALRTAALLACVVHVGATVAGAWGGPRLAPVRAADLRIPAAFPPADLPQLGALVARLPGLWRVAAPGPDRIRLPLEQALGHIEADRLAEGGSEAGLVLATRRVEITGLVLARGAAGVRHLAIVEPPGLRGVEAALQRGQLVYTLELCLARRGGCAGSQTAWIDRKQPELVVELPVELAEGGGPGLLRVRRF